MRVAIWLGLTLGLLVTEASAQMVLFDFDNAPLHSPLPLDLTVDGIRAHLSSGSPLYNYSVQQADVLGFTPAGFSGNCIYPGSVFQSDLLIAFDQPLQRIAIMYAPEEYATDSSCTMRLTAYSGPNVVGTTTTIIDPPGTWPTGTLSLSTALSFDNVVIHYDHAPVTGGDYGPIFMADNLAVAPVPEPRDTAAIMLIGTGLLGIALRWRDELIRKRRHSAASWRSAA